MKALILGLACLMFVGGAVMPDNAIGDIIDHENFPIINTFTDDLVKTITNLQAAYFAQNQFYFQGIRIPATGNLDGITKGEINPALKPTDRDDSWLDFSSKDFAVGTKYPVHIQVDVYQSEDGHGWILIIDFYKEGIGPDKYGNSGEHWMYKHNEGPEGFSGIWSDWFIVPEE